MNWQIVDCQPEYLDALRRLYREVRIQTFVWADTSTFTLDDFDSATRDESVRVAISAGRPIGFVSWWLPDNFVHNLYVDPRVVRQGVGKALLNQCLAKLGRPATLKCLQKNTNAVAFYQKQGWQIKAEGQSAEGAYYLMMLTE